jgi:hypothetical protein
LHNILLLKLKFTIIIRKCGAYQFPKGYFNELGYTTTSMDAVIQKTQRTSFLIFICESILRNIFFNYMKVDISSTQLIVTEPIFNLSFTQECLEELVFEEFGFDGFIRTTRMKMIKFTVYEPFCSFETYFSV